MPDVKRARYVWRRHHDAKFTAVFADVFVRVYLEISAFFPNFIKFIFYLFCVIKFRHILSLIIV